MYSQKFPFIIVIVVLILIFLVFKCRTYKSLGGGTINTPPPNDGSIPDPLYIIAIIIS